MNASNNTTSAEVRERLATSIQTRNAATDAVARGQAALSRATALVEKLDLAAKQLSSNLETQTLQTAGTLADQLRAGAPVQPVHHAVPIAHEEHSAALAQLKVATQAREQLRGETDAPCAALASAEGEVREGAFSVMRLETEHIADAIAQREAEAYQMRTCLKGLAMAEYTLMQGNRAAPIRPHLLPARAVVASERSPDPQHAGGTDPVKDQMKRWVKFYEALQNDAQAQFGG
jgi:hypothetical protein